MDAWWDERDVLRAVRESERSYKAEQARNLERAARSSQKHARRRYRREKQAALLASERLAEAEADERFQADLQAAIEESTRAARRDAVSNELEKLERKIKRIKAQSVDDADAATADVRTAARAFDRAVADADADIRNVMEFVHGCWRRQQGNLCGWHAIDIVLCALGVRDALTHDEFRAVLTRVAGSYTNYLSDTGYSIEALVVVLNEFDLANETVFFAATDTRPAFVRRLEDRAPQTADALIVGNSVHWMAFVRVNGSWFNVDSQNPSKKMRACNITSNAHYVKNGFDGVREYIETGVPEGGAVIVVRRA